jgi:hypothetical protein
MVLVVQLEAEALKLESERRKFEEEKQHFAFETLLKEAEAANVRRFHVMRTADSISCKTKGSRYPSSVTFFGSHFQHESTKFV